MRMKAHPAVLVYASGGSAMDVVHIRMTPGHGGARWRCVRLQQELPRQSR